MKLCTWEPLSNGLCYCPTCDQGRARPFRCGTKRPCGGARVHGPGFSAQGPAPPRPTGGPGTELRKIIHRFERIVGWLGIVLDDCTTCRDYARMMDSWGVDGCRQRRDQILDRLVTKAEENAALKHIPGKRIAAGRMLARAIKNAERAERASSNLDLLPRRPVGDVLRVAIATPALALGGVERWMMDLAKWLPAGVRICGVGVTSDLYRELGAVERMRGLAPVYGYSVAETRQAWADADVLIVWGITDPAAAIGPTAARVVCCAHGSDRQWTLSYVRACARQGWPIVAVSQHCGEVCRSAVDPRLVTVIDNGIDLARCTPTRTRADARVALGIPPDMFVVGYLGRLSREKRCELVIEAAAGNGCGALFVGDGDQRGFLNDLAERRGCRGRTWFAGFREAPAVWLVAADCMMSGDHYQEGFWLAGAEAAAMGLPIVSPRTGVLHSIAARHGVLWTEMPGPPTPVDAVAAVARVIRDRPDPEPLRQVVLRDYTAAEMGRRWAEYLWALREGR